MKFRTQGLVVAAVSIVAGVACAGPAVTLESTPPPSDPDSGVAVMPSMDAAVDAAAEAATATDPCGSCAKFGFCDFGECRCPRGFETVCSNTCVDTMNDSANCGKCGNHCTAPAGKEARCGGGVCRTIEEFAIPPTPAGQATVGIALTGDEDSLYLVAADVIFSVDKATLGTFVPLTQTFANEAQSARTIVAAGGSVYYAGGPWKGVSRLAKSGGTSINIAPNARARSLAATATHLYIGTASAIYVTRLADGPALPEIELFLAVGASHLAVRGDWLYFAEAVMYTDSATIGRINLVTEVREDLATSTAVTGLAPLPDGLAWSSGAVWDGPDVYGDLAVFRWKASPRKIEMLAKGGFPAGIVADDQNVFWTNGRGGGIDEDTHALAAIGIAPGSQKMHLAVTDDPIVSPGVVTMSSPVASEDALYWLDRSVTNGRAVIRRLTPR